VGGSRPEKCLKGEGGVCGEREALEQVGRLRKGDGLPEREVRMARQARTTYEEGRRDFLLQLPLVQSITLITTYLPR